MFTLQHSGIEKSLADWGLATDLQLQRASQSVDTCTISAPGLMDAALLFAYGDAIIIRRDRTGSGTTWSGGSIWFQGKATTPQRTGNGSAERLRYRFHGPWWDLQRIVLQQVWHNYYGIVSAPAGTEGVDWSKATVNGVVTYFTLQRTSELFLGITHAGTLLNSGAQITEAANWAITCGANLQLGVIDPAVNFVTYNCRDITVGEVILQMLRWSPDAVTWFDYTTTPPTLNVRKLANLATVTVTPPADKVRELALVPRSDLQLPAVVIRFKSATNVDGDSWVSIVTQKYPGGATGLELGASVHTIELTGQSLTRTKSSVTLATVAAQSATEADRIAWWAEKLELLKDVKVAAASRHITVATVKDAAGNTVNLADYPRELLDGSLADWTGYNEKSVTVEAVATYDLYLDDAHLNLCQRARQKIINVRIKVTNAPVTEGDGATGKYSTVSSFTAAEPVPSGLAQSVYESLAVLQYEGSLSLVGSEVPTGLALGKKLTIAGLDIAISNQLIQQVTEEPHLGRISVSIGPPAHLGITDLIELLRVNRYRTAVSWSPRTTGQAGNGGEVDLGKNGPRENTVAGHGEAQMQTVNTPDGANTALSQMQAVVPATGSPDPAWVAQRVVTATGVQAASTAKVNARLSQLPASAEAKFRKVYLCLNGVLTEAYVLSTAGVA